MLLAMKKATFPIHIDQLYQIKSPTLVMGGEGMEGKDLELFLMR